MSVCMYRYVCACVTVLHGDCVWTVSCLTVAGCTDTPNLLGPDLSSFIVIREQKGKPVFIIYCSKWALSDQMLKVDM